MLEIIHSSSFIIIENNTGLLAGVGTSRQISNSSVDSTKYLFNPSEKSEGFALTSGGKLPKIIISMKKQEKATEKANPTLPPYTATKSELKSLENLKKHLGRGFSKYFNN